MWCGSEVADNHLTQPQVADKVREEGGLLRWLHETVFPILVIHLERILYVVTGADYHNYPRSRGEVTYSSVRRLADCPRKKHTVWSRANKDLDGKLISD
jgi:hypothetical protein